MNKIFQFIAQISLLLYPLSLSKKISKQLDKVYTWRIASAFESMGGGKILIQRYINIWHPENITIGKNIHVFNNCQLATHPNNRFPTPTLTIGDDCEIGEQTHITCANKITIGNNLLTGRRCVITDNSHGLSTRDVLDTNPRLRNIESKGSVTIGNNVWLGDNVIVLPGVSIGDGVIVGANAVVTKNLPSYCVAAGNPAKVIKVISD